MDSFDQLENLEIRYDEINAMLSDPEITKDSKKLTELSKEEGDLRDTVHVYREYKKILADLEGTEEVLADSSDAELTELAELEKEELLESKENSEEELRILLIPKDENDGKNIIMEIRGEAGGDEDQLFAGDLFHMYQQYADQQDWLTEVLESHPIVIGGYNEIILYFSGKKFDEKIKTEI